MKVSKKIEERYSYVLIANEMSIRKTGFFVGIRKSNWRHFVQTLQYKAASSYIVNARVLWISRTTF